MSPKTSALRLLFLAATATAIPASAIFARQDSSCDARGYERCGSDFPDYFCCPEGSRCMSLAGDTTIMCCPNNQQCESLGPITCNIRAQDAEKDHRLPLKTTVFDVELEKCGDDGCCPFGFTCEDGDDGKECKKAKDQSKPPGEDRDEDSTSTAISSTKTSEPTSTSEPSSDASSTTDANPTATNDESSSGDSSNSDSGPDTTSIIGGVVGACAVLLIVAVILFVCVRKRAKRRPAGTPPPPQPPTTQVLHGRNISGPTNVEQNPDFGRCEFLQKRDNEPGEGLDDHGDGLGVLYPRPPKPPGLNRPSSRFSQDTSERGSTQFPFGSSSPNPSLPETPLDRIPSNEMLRNGRVTSASVPPIRSMKSAVRTKSRHLHPEMARDIPRQLVPRPARPTRGDDDAASDTIPIMTEPQQALYEGEGQNSGRTNPNLNEDDHDRTTRFSFSKMLDATKMSGVGKDKTYVPWKGATPRI